MKYPLPYGTNKAFNEFLNKESLNLNDIKKEKDKEAYLTLIKSGHVTITDSQIKPTTQGLITLAEISEKNASPQEGISLIGLYLSILSMLISIINLYLNNYDKTVQPNSNINSIIILFLLIFCIIVAIILDLVLSKIVSKYARHTIIRGIAIIVLTLLSYASLRNNWLLYFDTLITNIVKPILN